MPEHPTITELRKLRKPSDRSVELVRLTESTAAAKSWVAQSALAAPHLLAEVDALRAQLADLRRAVLMAQSEERACPTWCDGLRCVCGAEDQNLARAAARLALGLGVK